MKILVVTACIASMRRLLFEGMRGSAGLPSQEYVLKSMVEKGWEVDMIVSGSNLEIDTQIEADWLKKINRITFVERKESVLQKVFFMARIKKEVKYVLERYEYDFVYFQGADGSPAISVVTKRGIACGQRLFGTGHMIRALYPGGKAYVFFRYFPQYCAFVLKKDFLLITNDGSKAKEVCTRICGDRLPYRLEIWNNGVHYSQEKLFTESSNPHPSRPYIFYGARVTSYKGQNRAIEVLHLLEEAGKSIDLICAGDIEDRAFYQELINLIQKYHLFDYVKFLGNITSLEMDRYRTFAEVNLFMADGTNRGNSLIESMAVGSAVVVLDDHSCNDFIKHRESGMLVSDCAGAAQAILEVMDTPKLSKHLREQSVKSCLKEFPPWNVRVQKELAYIQDCVEQKRGDLNE